MDTLPPFALRHWNAAVEILLMAAVIYFGWRHFRGTRGSRVLVGVTVFLVGLTLLAKLLRLEVTSWLLAHSPLFFAVSLVVIFQPELRRTFAGLGSGRLFGGARQRREELAELCECVFALADRQHGALIAIEREVGVRAQAESGVEIDCAFSTELMRTIFWPKTPLHDGGVVLRGGRIIAAACIFPVSQRESLDRSFGLRHRAGLGISEETDAVAIVVSEETGSVALCHRGQIARGLGPEEFRRRLERLLLGRRLLQGTGGGKVVAVPVTPRPEERDAA